MNSVATVELQYLRSEAGAGVSRAKRGLSSGWAALQQPAGAGGVVGDWEDFK